ncbi:MAG TPA: hypothetical protein VGS28_04525 [Candidatus Saccharimonadales bacterium]|nr:hypothetical protein [Candidatus Saccharimonadales bacterium]
MDTLRLPVQHDDERQQERQTPEWLATSEFDLDRMTPPGVLHVSLKGAEHRRRIWESGIGPINRRFNLSRWEDTPLLTGREARHRLGFPIGALLGVIDLPETDRDILRTPREKATLEEQLKVYLFAGPDNRVLVMGGHEIRRLRDYRRAFRGREHKEGPQFGDSIVSLGVGDKLVIGRDWWLPGMGYQTNILQLDENLARTFGSVSREHATVEINDNDEIIVNNVSAMNDIEVEFGTPASGSHASETPLPVSEVLRRTVLPRGGRHTAEYVRRHRSPSPHRSLDETMLFGPQGLTERFVHFYRTATFGKLGGQHR